MSFCAWSPPERDLTSDERAAICEWLRAHDLDPNTVEDGCVAVVYRDKRRELHVTEYVTGADGGRVVDYAASRLVTRPKVVPLVTDPPIPGASRA